MATPDEINSLKSLLSFVPKNDDTKLSELLKNIRLIKSQNQDEKFIIFTEYLATQDYIVQKLRDVYGETDVVYIRGGDHEEKINATKTFKKAAHFLVSTQAGGEGINLQHCHIVVNYDMPWNPMKVEQRIGRVHRYKQKDTVQVYNMFARDTIEDRIYERLEDKLVEISQTIGDDDEREALCENILGIVAEELNFDELYKEVLKKGQNEIYITQEKIDDAIRRAKEIYEKLGDFTQELEKFSLEKFFKTKGKFSLEDIKNFVLKFIQSENKRASMDEDDNYEFIVPEVIQSYGNLKQTRITFDRNKAIEDTTLQFMAIGHPVTDSIIMKCSGYGYGGRCVKRQISHSEYKGESGIQLNFTIEYQILLHGKEKNKTLQKDLIVLLFDKDSNYRKDLEPLSLIESEKKIKENDFAFITEQYLLRIEVIAKNKLQEIIEENIEILQQQYSNVIYKHNLESLAFFVVS